MNTLFQPFSSLTIVLKQLLKEPEGMTNKGEVDSYSPKFVKTRGSKVAGRYKDKKERIHEAMCDLKLAVDGVIAQLAQSDQFDQLPQSAAALARACSIFLRKMVLGDWGDPKTRLLNDEISQSLDMRFEKLRKISPNRRLIEIIPLDVYSGLMQLTKLDDNTRQPQSVYNMPIAPLQFKISIEWPLPGVADWTETPTKDKPWQVKAEELFDTHSNDILGCDAWLGQQLVMFDKKGISLKDVIRTIVNYEGAHSINVSRLMHTENEMDSEPSKNPKLHILNNIKIYGIKYNHLIVIETALYLYAKLLKNKEIENPKGEKNIPTICVFSESPEGVFSSSPKWLAYDGGIILSFGDRPQLISHKIRAVK